jgi:hypothetical protein
MNYGPWILASILVIPGWAAVNGREVTFCRDIAPILYKHCASCHHTSEIAPMPLVTYKEVRPWAAAIQEAVLLRKMPPWKADPHYGKWSNDPTLTDTEIETIKAWAQGAKLEGDPKDLPPAPTFSTEWKPGKPDVVISIPEHTLEANGPDEYSNVVLPSNFKEDTWVVAAELRPGNRKIVHHAHVFVAEDDRPAASGQKADPTAEYRRWLMIHQGTLSFVRPEAPVINDGCVVDDNGSFPGEKQSDLIDLIASYLPGREPDVFPPGTARRIPAGAKLRFDIHYSRTTHKKETDVTSVGLYFAKQPPRQVARRIDPSNYMFLVPAGAADHEVTECHTFQKDMYITSLTPHMHLRGKSMRLVATYPDGRNEILLNVPRYDFDWQITYRAAQPIFIPNGTRIAIISHFDNSANNPVNPDPSKAVRWGSASQMEMMDCWIEYLDAAPTPASVTSARLP